MEVIYYAVRIMSVISTEDKCPRQSSNVQEYILLDEVLLYHSELEEAVSLNKSSKKIWELYDGKHTLAEISQRLGQDLGISENHSLLGLLLSDIISTTNQLYELNLIEFELSSHS